MEPHGPEVAAGRDSVIYDHGEGRVLRLAREPRDLEPEAEVMNHARSNGYPVPEVFEAGHGFIVMERVAGTTMLDDSIPFRIKRNGRLLAELHHRLHRIPAPSFLTTACPLEGDRLIHGDLHPLNVLITDDGPVVIDWANACRGAPRFDEADAWVVFACADPPPGRLMRSLAPVGRRRFLQGFLSRIDQDRARTAIAAVVEHRSSDPNFSDAERARMHRLAATSAR